MAWTAPRTWRPGERPTSTLLNEQLRDNLLAVGDHDTWTTNTSATLEAVTTNPTMGSGATTTFMYQVTSSIITLFWRFVFGTGASAGSGVYVITPPRDVNLGLGGVQEVLGGGWMYDSSGSDRYLLMPVRQSSTSLRFRWDTGTGAGNFVTESSPFTWAAGDELVGWAKYRI